MTTAAVKQFNRTAEKRNRNSDSYKMTRIYTTFSATPSAALIGSYIADHSKAGKPCRYSKRYMADKLSVSMSTMFRSIKTLYGEQLIERDNRELSANIDKNKYIKWPEFLSGYVFDFELKKSGKIIGYRRALNRSELKIFGIMFTWTESPKCETEYYLTSNSMLSKIADLSEKTVSNALHVLLKCNLITRTADNKGTSSAHMSSYRINKKTLKQIYRQLTDQEKPAQKGKADSSGHPPREEVERYYSELRNAAELEAEDNLKECLKDREFRRLDKQEKELTINEAMAEAKAGYKASPGDREKAKELGKQLIEIRRLKVLRLEELGFYEEDLKPRYRCRICSDTGFDRSGNRCKCYYIHWNLSK